jgi:thiol:disulfide interchange protein DsbD
LISWTAFDEAEVDRHLREGRSVFVDVTADWCITCKFNERLVLETEAVAEAFAGRGIVAMKADWTNRDRQIEAFLARFGRSSVPTYVLFRPGLEPRLFPELLTREMLLDALAESSDRPS